jgi:serine/threonine-protein kinase
LVQVIACGMAKNPADRYASCGDLAVAAYAALASPDQDRATDILQRSQVAAPAAFAGPPSSGFTPAPSAPQPTPWTGAPVWSTGVATGPGAPPPWGQPARVGSLSELAQLAKTVGVDANAIACIKSGDDVGTAKAKAASAATTLSRFNASGTPFVWDGNKSVNYQDPGWLTRLIG